MKTVHNIPILSHSTLKQYQEIINSIPNLTRDEEVKYILNKNMEMMYFQGLKWVYFYARKFRNRFDILDLIQQGNLGLWKALQDFDITKNIKFITYASLWIRSYIFEYVIKNLGIVSTQSKTLRKKFFKKEVDDLLYEYNNLIMNNANIYLSEFDNEILISKVDIEEEFIEKDLLMNKMNNIKKEIDNLCYKHKKIIKEHFINEKPLTIISKALNITRQAVHGLKSTAIKKIKKSLADY